MWQLLKINYVFEHCQNVHFDWEIEHGTFKGEGDCLCGGVMEPLDDAESLRFSHLHID